MRIARFWRAAIRWLVVVSACVGGVSAAEGGADPDEKTLAPQILVTTGVKGGLIVHVGCGGGKLTAALRAKDSYLVHGLDADAGNIEKAREHIRSLGLYGKVSVEQWKSDRLPYTDNLVNLLVAEDLGEVPVQEVMRVLAPNGVAYIKKGGKWTKTVKPRPEEIDEWGQFLHGADGNAVATDSVVGPPRHVQWVGGPRWARSHEQLASITTVVSAAGRIFYIVDEGPIASIRLPSKWLLVARDAHNGVILWKRPIASWEPHLRAFRSGPPHLHRRLVAVEERVYVTLGFRAPLSALDAATGKVVKTYEGTEGTEEIVSHRGILFLVVGSAAAEQAAQGAQRRGKPAPSSAKPVKSLLAIKADTGVLVWKKSGADTAQLMSLTLAARGERVFFQNQEAVLCLDLKSGRQIWRSARAVALKRPGWSAPTLVAHDGVVLSADRRDLVALSAKTGRSLWTCKAGEGYNSPVDVFVAGGLVWVGESNRRRGPDFTVGRDPATGEVKKRISTDKAYRNAGMPHHRCYRNRATDRYILGGRAGVEFIDLEAGGALRHHWIRGTCQYGILPCNGLLYVPPDSCACFIRAKLSGFYALAAARKRRSTTPPGQASHRLEKGPADAQVGNRQLAIGNPHDWPTYRHDPARSGSTKVSVPAALKHAWQADLGGRLSSLVVAGGKVFVASLDTHTVHALDAKDGKPLWSYTVGGRVDSPPTIHEGLALFGSADGWVYCLRASDGKLVWRFRGAAEDRRVVAFGRLESAWPVHGNVLVQDGVAYFAAGRSSYLDGGIYLYRLEPKTGKRLSETRICSRDPKTGEQPDNKIRGFEMPGALPDVLSSDGTSVYMRHVKFDRQAAQQAGSGLHLFTPTGFLDDTWWHRSYWVYGTSFSAGWGGWWRVGNRVPSGRLLVFDESSIYGFGRNFYAGGNAGQWRGGEEYRLFATSKKAASAKKPAAKRKRGRRPRVKSTLKYRWSKRVPLLVRAMVLADKRLFVAGPPDLEQPKAKNRLELANPEAAVAAFGGKKGGVLWAVSAADGKRLAEYELESPPVFDAMAAANGRLYLSTGDGKVLCFAGR